MWQNIATWTLVALALAYVGWMIFRTFARQKSGGCGTGCGTGCPTDIQAKPLVTLDPHSVAKGKRS